MKKIFILIIFIIIFIDIIIGVIFLKYRPFPRLAIWNIVESGRVSDFYWPPDKAPGYFYFEQNGHDLALFKTDISNVINPEENDELSKLLTITEYIMALGKNAPYGKKMADWDSPLNMLKQIKEGRPVNCFPYSIIFSTYLSSIGIKSRLWALEGDDGLSRFGHTVVEAYIKDLNKWVMFDVTNKIYFRENTTPLSVLELRDRLLNKNTKNLRIEASPGAIFDENFLSNLYSRFLKMVFLRGSNDFVNKYGPITRYGKLYRMRALLDRLPSEARRGISYFIGRRDYLIHYLDNFDKSLKSKIILAKTAFWFFITSTAFLFFLCLFGMIKFLSIPGMRRYN